MAADAEIGKNVKISPFVYIGARVKIGEGTFFYPNVTILDDVEIGKRVVIGPGSVIGVEGFGYEKVGEEYKKLPHRGKVVIEDDVEIGANVTIARAKTGETRIGAGTKIDCLVHIGHNVQIGKNCIIIAQVGIGGSAKIGNNVILAGQVGIKDHVTIGDNAIVYAKSGLFKSIPANAKYFGIPARPHPQILRLWSKLLKIYASKDD
ncbi:MAG: UDP-3-O-(3-hydroxymyristoyl)glucosamine N-acyltransferase [candidate division WOR-3 bacterium]